MFNIDIAKHIASLSMLELSQEDLEILTDEMSDIIKLMEKVTEFKHVSAKQSSEAVPYGKLRCDETNPSSDVSDIISNSKRKENNCFTVPKII